MSFCCAAESQFDRDRVERDLRRYRRRGADAVTKLLLAELRRWPLHGKQLLDVGGGIGLVGAGLAAAGIAGVTLVEASPSYLEAARTELEPLYAPRPARFLLGDFALMTDSVPETDIATLDRVVCCYPGAEALLQAAAKRTRHLLAFTYPRDRWYMRVTTTIQNFLRRMRGNPFRTFIHSPQKMSAVLERNGLVRAATRGTLVWVVDLYHRQDAG